jgi:hypothetical protein
MFRPFSFQQVGSAISVPRITTKEHPAPPDTDRNTDKRGGPLQGRVGVTGSQADLCEGTAAWRAQGQYLGELRHLSQTGRAQVKRVREAKGVRAAIRGGAEEGERIAVSAAASRRAGWVRLPHASANGRPLAAANRTCGGISFLRVSASDSGLKAVSGG